MEQASPKARVQLAIFYRPSQDLMKFTVAVCIKTSQCLFPLPGRLEDDTQTTVPRYYWHRDTSKGEIEIKGPTTHNQDSSLATRPNPKENLQRAPQAPMAFQTCCRSEGRSTKTTKSSAYNKSVTLGVPGPPKVTPGQTRHAVAETLLNNMANKSGPSTLP